MGQGSWTHTFALLSRAITSLATEDNKSLANDESVKSGFSATKAKQFAKMSNLVNLKVAVYHLIKLRDIARKNSFWLASSLQSHGIVKLSNFTPQIYSALLSVFRRHNDITNYTYSDSGRSF